MAQLYPQLINQVDDLVEVEVERVYNNHGHDYYKFQSKEWWYYEFHYREGDPVTLNTVDGKKYAGIITEVRINAKQEQWIEGRTIVINKITRKVLSELRCKSHGRHLLSCYGCCQWCKMDLKDLQIQYLKDVCNIELENS